MLAYACWFRIIRALPAAVAGLTTLVVPCIGFGSSALMTAAPVSWLDAVALALIIAAVTLALARRSQPNGRARRRADTDELSPTQNSSLRVAREVAR